MKHFALLFLLLVLATSCANNKDNTSNTAANHDNNRQHKTRDDSPAEIAPGQFRVDKGFGLKAHHFHANKGG